MARLLSLFGLMLLLVAGWLYRAAPPSEACMALPTIVTLRDSQALRWDADTQVEVAPQGFTLLQWQRG